MIFIVHVAIRDKKDMPLHSKKKAQIEALLFDKVLIEVPAEYSNYSNIFLAKYVAKFPENIGINEHVIKLEKEKQPLFGPIYSLGSMELATLKTYIKINLVNGFIRSSKSPIGAPILFDRKPNRTFHLCIDY